MPTDTERLDFLSRGASFVYAREVDCFRSDIPLGKRVTFMVNGRGRAVEGETLREAVDAAMEKHWQMHVPTKGTSNG